MALAFFILFPSCFLPFTFMIIWGAWCVLICMNLERDWVATVYLEDFIDFWNHFLLSKLFIFHWTENWSSFNWIFYVFQWKKAISYIIIGSHVSHQFYQCLGDSSQTSPGNIRWLVWWGSTLERRGNFRSPERVLKGEIENK